MDFIDLSFAGRRCAAVSSKSEETPRRDHLRIRLGGRSLTAHVPSIPVFAFAARLGVVVSQLWHDTAPLTVSLGETPHRLIFQRAPSGILLTITDTEGPPIIVERSVDPGTLRDATQVLLDALSAEFPALRSIATALRSAPHRVATAHERAPAERAPPLDHLTRHAEARIARALALPDRCPHGAFERIAPAAAVAPADDEGPKLPAAQLHRLAWRRAWRREAPGLRHVVTHGQTLQVFDARGLSSIAQHNGGVRWQAPGVHPLSGAPAGFGFGEDGRILAICPERGRVQWRSAHVLSQPPRHVERHHERLLYITEGGVLFGLDASSGRHLFQVAPLYGHVVGATIGRLGWTTAEDGLLRGFDLTTGCVRAQWRLPGQAVGPPIIVGPRQVVSVQRAPATRQTLVTSRPGGWTHVFDGQLMGPAQTVRDRLVLTLHHGLAAQILVIGLTDGLLRWRVVLPEAEGWKVTAIGDALYAKCLGAAVHCLALSDGRQRWALPVEDHALELDRNASPTRCRGVLLVPGLKVRAVDPATGRTIDTLDCDDLVPRSMHAWASGDLTVIEGEALARYDLSGHLASVP